MNRIERIRSEEKKYHDACYENRKLFEPGTWLHRPVKTVLDALNHFQSRERVDVLDLGSGIGRNGIPIAEFVRSRSGRVVCVDLLPSAIDRLTAYAKEYEVEPYVEPVLSDIEAYRIAPSAFDLIVAVSALEHVSTERALVRKLGEMAAGTRPDGINCIIVGTNTRETAVGTGEALDPMFEVNLPTDTMLDLLDRAYSGWDVQARLVKPLAYDIDRDGVPVKLTTDCVTYVARKS